jgi:transposase
MIVIGADIHKSSHALAAVNATTGVIVGELEVKARESGHLEALRWARELDGDRVWAIEDCRHLSRRIEESLLAAGGRVVRVPPKMMDASRRGEREPGKSDQIDARAVARAVIREGVQQFPAAFLDERALEIRVLADHRQSIVAECTRQIDRLRWHLVDICCPELEASIPARQLNNRPTLQRIARHLRREQQRTARRRVALELVASIRALSRQADTLQRELHTLVASYQPDLLAQQGCGTLTAATLIGRAAGAQRFPTDAHFARHAAVSHQSPCPPDAQTATACTAAATANSTGHCTQSPSHAPASTPKPAPTSSASAAKARPNARPYAASSATSHATSTAPSRHPTPHTTPPTHPKPAIPVATLT